ncbi:MAG: DUF2892 domain-containing protein [Anaerolineae bacterium]
MIDRNIGKTERIVRFALAVLLIAWVINSERFAIPQGVGLLAAFALLWNSIFARCYLWKWLKISSCDPRAGDCSSGGSGGTGPSQA